MCDGRVDSATANLALLYRRAGFGASAAELRTAGAAGYEATVASWVGGLGQPDPGTSALTPPPLTPFPDDDAAIGGPGSPGRLALQASLRREFPTLVRWWVARMMAAVNPLTEKLPLLLHNQFPTAVSKVQFPSLMLGQNMVFRRAGSGSFGALTLAVAQDPAMLIWLDANTDHRAHPNENFARELFERFTLGIGNYTQADVTAAAACFTGWRFDPAVGGFRFAAADHDPAPQTVLGQAGVNTGEQVIAIATSSPASARWVVSRMWSFLASPVTPADPVVAGLAPAYQADLDMSGLLRSILLHPQFTAAPSVGGLVKQPVEWVAGTLKALGVSPAAVADGTVPVTTVLAGLGQVPFDPPSVGGWPQNEAWLSTAATLVRWEVAARLVRSPLVDLSAVADASAGDRPDAAATLLSVPSWSSPTANALAQVADDPVELTALALVSPEYVSN